MTPKPINKIALSLEVPIGQQYLSSFLLNIFVMLYCCSMPFTQSSHLSGKCLLNSLMDYQISWLMPLTLLSIIKYTMHFNLLPSVMCWVELSALVLYIFVILFLSFGILLNRKLNMGTLKLHWTWISLYEFFTQLKASEFQEFILCLSVANLVFTVCLNENLRLRFITYTFTNACSSLTFLSFYSCNRLSRYKLNMRDLQKSCYFKAMSSP